MKFEAIQLRRLIKQVTMVAGGCFLSLLSPGAVASAPTTARTLHVRIVPQLNSRPLVFDGMMSTNATGQLLSVTRADLLVADFAVRGTDGIWIESTNFQAYLNLREARTSFDIEHLSTGNFDRIRF